MKNYLVSPTRTLEENEMELRNRFLQQFPDYEYVLQNGEVFAQCIDHRWNDKFYNPNWFISNKGYLVSAARRELHLNKPSLKTGGLREGNTTRWTEYIQRTYPNWERDRKKGYYPLYYFYKNTYPKTHGLSDKVFSITMAHLVAIYFLPEADKAKVVDPLWELHHIMPFDWNRAPQFSNWAGNFQMLREEPNTNMREHPERRQHFALHSFAKETSPEAIADLMEKATAPGVPHLIFTEEHGLENWVLAGLRYMAQQDPEAPVLVAVKNEDGSQHSNSYHTVAGVK